MAGRFRGFLPVIIDVETGGFDARSHALLEIAAVLLRMDLKGRLWPHRTVAYHIKPFPGSKIDAAALQITGIDPHHPFRQALPEKQALQELFQPIRQEIRAHGCSRAVLVGHNAYFDLNFLNAAISRGGIKRNPFHQFTCFDTSTLAGLAYGQTVLARALEAAGLSWDEREAHSAIYDAERTAELFCGIVNRWLQLGGWDRDQGQTQLPTQAGQSTT
jgi:ribonuclease T